MTDHKFTDDEIIKALECCKQPIPICTDCPIGEGDMCFDFMKECAIGIINRQKAEIERLEKHLVFEIESAYDRGRKSAIKEFAERLKPKLSFYDEVYVDNLVYEMTEEQK